jgi:uncharacterized membrane protein YccF (DUF307 family)
MLRLIGNLIWLFFGGLETALGWFIACAICAISIVGIPWARACFNIGLFALWPFGSEAVDRSVLYGEKDVGTGVLGMIGNVLWFVVAGWWLAIAHVFAAILNAVTIIGIPFAVVHLKLAGIALFPIGKAIIPKDEAYRRGLQIARLPGDSPHE